ncbi:MAG TPA: MBL fold metallo-hydrolase [Chitinophagaceae bacterium]|nr:MBL fold metallo-hydrolase [Chitinophagaceae bacterium]
MIEVQSFTFNPFQENTYLLINEKRACFIIDPGCYFTNERKALTDAITAGQVEPVRLLNTHCHLDHIFGNKLMDERYGLRTWIHPLEQPVLDNALQSGLMFNVPFDPPPHPAGYLEDTEKIHWGADTLEVILAPGHSPGSICFYCEKQKFLLGGDVLFRESIGRSDLPGGDYDTLERSILERLYVLPDDVTVYPGHGPQTTIGHEKRNNPYVRTGASPK